MQLTFKEIVGKIFYIIIGVYYFLSIMTITMLQYKEISFQTKLIRYICYFIFVLIIIYNIIDYKKNITNKSYFFRCWNYIISHFILIIILVITVVIIIESGDKLPLILVLLIWVSSFYDFKKIVYIYIGTTATLMLITFILTYKGILPQIVNERIDYIRYSMGYIYPLELASHFLFLVLSIFYLYGKKLDYQCIVFINILNFLFYMITDARTSFYLIIIVSIMILIILNTRISIILNKITFKIYYLFLLLCSFGTIIIGIIYTRENNFLLELDKKISGRIELMHCALKKYGITIWGQKIEWVGLGGIQDETTVIGYNFVDNAYAKILLDYGLVFFILVIIGYAIIYKTANEQKDYMLIIVISVILVLSVMEPRLVSIEMNPFVLLLGRFFMMEISNKRIK